jgi:hypothetical protein
VADSTAAMINEEDAVGVADGVVAEMLVDGVFA